MEYSFKLRAEIGWAAVAAIVTVVLTALAEMETGNITDWKLWATGVGIAAIRSAAGAALAAFGRGTLSR